MDDAWRGLLDEAEGAESRMALRVPAQKECLLAVRLLSSGAGARAGFTLQGLDDCKTAVAEACHFLMEQQNGFEALQITYLCESGGLFVRVRGCGARQTRAGGYPADTRVAAMVLGTLARDTGFACDETGAVSAIDLAMAEG